MVPFVSLSFKNFSWPAFLLKYKRTDNFRSFFYSFYSIGKLMNVHMRYFTLNFFRFPAKVIKVKLANVHF